MKLPYVPRPLHWRVVAEREITTQLRSRAFQLTFGALLLGIVALVVVTTLVAGREETREVAVVDAAASVAVEQAATLVARTDGVAMSGTTYDDVAAAEQAVRDGDAALALLPRGGGYDLVGDTEVDPVLARALSAAVATLITSANAADQGVDLEALGQGAEVGQRLLDPDADNAVLRQLASFVFVILFYLTALTFGMGIAVSVTQEKESRVVEILAAAVPIRALLWGKVIGVSALAIGQTVVLALVGVVALLVTGNSEALTLLAPAISWYVVFFVLGFVALASVWSVAGSLASRQQDLQGTTAPIQLVLFAPYLIAVLAGEGVRTAVSMLPIVSTMLMPARLAEGDVPWWQLAVAIVATLAAAVVLVRAGAQIYERTLLRTGNRIGFGEALRAATNDPDDPEEPGQPEEQDGAAGSRDASAALGL